MVRSRTTAAFRDRPLAVLEGDDIIWFWVGSHDEYERLINLPYRSPTALLPRTRCARR